jgi:hypothetical protein
MRKRIKKGLDSSPDLRKTTKHASGKLLSNPFIPNFNRTVYTQLGDPRPVWVCFACGSSKDLTKYHGAGGMLAICASCKNGGIK